MSAATSPAAAVDRELRGMLEELKRRVSEFSGLNLRSYGTARLTAVVRRESAVAGVAEPKEFLRRVLRDDDPDLFGALMDRLTTHYTYFFREPEQLRFFRDELKAGRPGRADRSLRIWSAGCAGGEEAYTLAIILAEYARREFAVLGTDISPPAVRSARAGEYAVETVESLPRFARRHFENASSDRPRISEELRRSVRFGVLNLNRESYPFSGGFDAIFCRNVLIYMDEEAGRGIVRRLTEHLTPGGLLFLGLTERLPIIEAGRLEKLGPSVHRRIQ